LVRSASGSETSDCEADSPKTKIIETPDGEWARWHMARAAAREHVEEVLAEAQAALDVLGRSGNYHEYTLRHEAAPERRAACFSVDGGASRAGGS
jgi:hypothetical protein